MKKWAIFYYERVGRRSKEVCWITRAKTKEDAKIDFDFEVASGNIDNFDWSKPVSISECH